MKRAWGKVLRAARLDAGLTQLDLGIRMGVSQGAVSHIESGKRDLREKTVRLFAEGLGKVAELRLRRQRRARA